MILERFYDTYIGLWIDAPISAVHKRHQRTKRTFQIPTWNWLYVKEGILSIPKIFLFLKSDNVKFVKWIVWACNWLLKQFYLTSFFGRFLFHTEFHTATLDVWSRMMDVDFYLWRSRAMVRRKKNPLTNGLHPSIVISNSLLSYPLWAGLNVNYYQ